MNLKEIKETFQERIKELGYRETALGNIPQITQRGSKELLAVVTEKEALISALRTIAKQRIEIRELQNVAKSASQISENQMYEIERLR